MPVQTDEDAYLCGQATRKELADDAREHYERISLEAHCWYSVIPNGIDAWEREPELLERIEGLEKELKQLREEDEIWDKHSLVQIVTERDELRDALKRLLNQFEGDWPQIAVGVGRRETGAPIWCILGIDDETRDAVLAGRSTLRKNLEEAHRLGQEQDLREAQATAPPPPKKPAPTSFTTITKSWERSDNYWWNQTITEGAVIPWWARIWKYDPLHHQMHILPIPLCWLARLGWNAWCASFRCRPNCLERMLEEARRLGHGQRRLEAEAIKGVN